MALCGALGAGKAALGRGSGKLANTAEEIVFNDGKNRRYDKHREQKTAEKLQTHAEPRAQLSRPSPLLCVVAVFFAQRAQCQVGSPNENFGRISATGICSASTAMPSATDHHLHKVAYRRPISLVATALPVHQPQIDRKEGVAGQKAFTIADLVSKSQERGRRTRIQRREKKGEESAPPPHHQRRRVME